MGEMTGLRRSLKLNPQKILHLALRGEVRIYGDNMVKEYILRIVFDESSDEIEHLSEKIDQRLAIEVEGRDVEISEEMSDYLLKNIDSEILGIS